MHGASEHALRALEGLPFFDQARGRKVLRDNFNNLGDNAFSRALGRRKCPCSSMFTDDADRGGFELMYQAMDADDNRSIDFGEFEAYLREKLHVAQKLMVPSKKQGGGQQSQARVGVATLQLTN